MIIYYTVYKTINLINNKFYIGVHQTKNPNDKYLGSGTLLRKAIKKYGKNNFTKEILFIYTTSEEMYKKEFEILTKEFIIKNKNICYNLRIGGSGGWLTLYQDKLIYFQQHPEYKKKKDNTMKNRFGINHMAQLHDHKSKMVKSIILKYQTITQQELNKIISTRETTMIQKYGVRNASLSTELIDKRNKTFKAIKHQQGQRNSQYETMWVYKNVNVKIHKTEYTLFQLKGFIKGRKMQLKTVKKQDIIGGK